MVKNKTKDFRFYNILFLILVGIIVILINILLAHVKSDLKIVEKPYTVNKELKKHYEEKQEEIKQQYMENLVINKGEEELEKQHQDILINNKKDSGNEYAEIALVKAKTVDLIITDLNTILQGKSFFINANTDEKKKVLAEETETILEYKNLIKEEHKLIIKYLEKEKHKDNIETYNLLLAIEDLLQSADNLITLSYEKNNLLLNILSEPHTKGYLEQNQEVLKEFILRVEIMLNVDTPLNKIDF